MKMDPICETKTRARMEVVSVSSQAEKHLLKGKPSGLLTVRYEILKLDSLRLIESDVVPARDYRLGATDRLRVQEALWQVLCLIP